MKQLTFILILLITGWSTSISAQNKTDLGNSDPRAKEILDKTSKLYKSYNSLKADFTMIVTNPKSKDISHQKGTIWVKGKKFKFSSGPIIVFCNNKDLWTYNKNNNEVQLTNYEPEDGQISPSSIFNDFYDKNFLYKLDGSMSLNGKKTQVIEMTPLDKTKSYFKILTWIDQQSNQIMQMKVFDKSGYKYTYQIDNFQPNAHLKSSDFVFSKNDFPGVSVQDLRL